VHRLGGNVVARLVTPRRVGEKRVKRPVGQPSIVSDITDQQRRVCRLTRRRQVGPRRLDGRRLQVDADRPACRPGQQSLDENRARTTHQVGDLVARPWLGKTDHRGGHRSVRRRRMTLHPPRSRR